MTKELNLRIRDKEEQISYIIERMTPYLKKYPLDDLLHLYIKIKDDSLEFGPPE